jgi:transcription factor Ssl1
MNEGHFKDILFELTPPPARRAVDCAGGPGTSPTAGLVMMGFPTRLLDSSPPGLRACHSDMKSEGFLRPRCMARVCDIPTDCDICGLMIVSSPHLARSYHHLFPVMMLRMWHFNRFTFISPTLSSQNCVESRQVPAGRRLSRTRKDICDFAASEGTGMSLHRKARLSCAYGL